jgi:cell division protein ZapA
MAQVSVQIDGKTYRMACEDGQEPHIERLATDLDRRISGLRQSVGEIGDMRLTIMGALTVADEAHDLRTRLAAAEARAEALEAAAAATGRQQAEDRAAAVAAVAAMAERVERLTRVLAAPAGEA